MKCKNCIFAHILEPIKNEMSFNVTKGLGNCSHKECTVILKDDACDNFKSKIKMEDKTNEHKATI